MISLYNGDCLEVMKQIPDGSIDLILTDPPYGTTKCKWDTVIPFEPLWEQLNRVLKINGAVILFSKQPFTTELIHSNLRDYKYSLVWKKDNHDNPMMAKKRVLNITEDINLFYKKQPTYNPQGIVRVNKITKQGAVNSSLVTATARGTEYLQEYTNYPKNILEFKRDLPNIHPTQKPVALLEYLIKTYTNEGDTVLDFTMGSGSTGVACKNTNRSFIGIELDRNYFEIANNRVAKLFDIAI